MQRRELDRNTGTGAYIPGCLLGDGRDGLGIGGMVALCILVGAGGFAEHVIGIGIALLFQFARVLHAGFDGFAQHELTPENLHRLADRGTHHRFAHSLDQTAQGAGRSLWVVLEHLAGQHQCPCRSIDQR